MLLGHAREDLGEIWGRYGGDIGEVLLRHAGEDLRRSALHARLIQTLTLTLILTLTLTLTLTCSGRRSMLATSQLPIHSIEQRMYSAGLDSQRARKADPTTHADECAARQYN